MTDANRQGAKLTWYLSFVALVAVVAVGGYLGLWISELGGADGREFMALLAVFSVSAIVWVLSLALEEICAGPTARGKLRGPRRLLVPLRNAVSWLAVPLVTASLFAGTIVGLLACIDAAGKTAGDSIILIILLTFLIGAVTVVLLWLAGFILEVLHTRATTRFMRQRSRMRTKSSSPKRRRSSGRLVTRDFDVTTERSISKKADELFRRGVRWRRIEALRSFGSPLAALGGVICFTVFDPWSSAERKTLFIECGATNEVTVEAMRGSTTWQDLRRRARDVLHLLEDNKVSRN